MTSSRTHRRSRSRKALPAAMLLAAGFPLAAAEATSLPRIDGVEAVASVNGEPISVDDLLQQVAAAHQGIEEPVEVAARPDPRALLDRLINVRLVLQEAQNIGLDQLPEVPAQIAAQRLEMIRTAVVEERVKDIRQGDPDTVERLFREAVRQFEIESVLLASSEQAEAFRRSVTSAAGFGERGAALAASGEALAYQAPERVPADRLQPEVRSRLLAMEAGTWSEPIPLAAGVAVVHLRGVVYPEDASARAAAEQEALYRKQQASLGEYGAELRARYATVDDELIASLDYEASDADLDGLRRDPRVVARIDGGEPITVGELTKRMEQKMFHGLERAAQQGRAAETLPVTLDRLIQERAVALEARRLGIEDRPEFLRSLQTAEDGLLFGKFVSKVIDPTVKLSDEEILAFHAEHVDDYSNPEMMGIEGVAFQRRDDAQAALVKLRQGADLKWMRANAPGQVPAEEVAPEWRFDGTLVPVTSLPPAVADAVAGAVGGDYRFCEQPGSNAYHVLWITRQFPSTPKAYEDVKQQIAVQVFARKRQKILEDWMERLRQASDIQVFVDAAQMRLLLGLGPAEDA